MGQMNRVPKGRVRLAIDFTDAEALLEFVDDLKQVYVTFGLADAYAQDALDTTSGSITPANTYVLKNGTDRLAGSSLRERVNG